MTFPSVLHFTKMHGAGNDFVVLNNMSGKLNLSPAFIQRVADRHFGVGADQVLIVEAPQSAENHFRYRIFNSDGHEVQQCGNGARCFAQYVIEKQLTTQTKLRVETLAGVIEPEVIGPNLVKVNMGPAAFDPSALPFLAEGLQTRQVGQLTQYCLPIEGQGSEFELWDLWVSVVSMGNPHVVIQLDSPATDEMVQRLGTILELHRLFPERVNVGFLNVIDSHQVNLRVFERGAGETLACGTGACAAVACAIHMGLLAERVAVFKKGGTLSIEWSGVLEQPIFMTGPAITVFEGEFSL
jgi:diaminopimelate epimerase